MARQNASMAILLEAAVSVLSMANNEVISDEGLILIQWIMYAVTCQVFSVFGTGTNIVNIICFIKQGFKDPVNVSLLGLAISDLGCLTTIIWIGISNTPTFITADLTFDPIEFNYVTIGMLHVSFSRVTCFITAFITLERCLCITAPLKVKMIITTKVTCTIIVSIFTIFLTSSAPVYAVNKLGLKFFPRKNKTLIGLVPAPDREIVENISFVITNQCFPIVAFAVIITCTIILVVKLYNTNKWRMKSVTSGQGHSISSRNQGVAKMVMMISAMFIACFVPISVNFLIISIFPGFTIDGVNRNVVMLIGALGLFMESINSSMNIFVYYHMSSRFREVFQGIFCTLQPLKYSDVIFK